MKGVEIKLKLKNGFLISLLLIVIQSGHAQGFVNLDFEDASVILVSPDEVEASSAIPGWTAYFDGNSASTIFYNTVSLGGEIVALEDENAPGGVPLPIQGRYSVLVQGPGPGLETSAAIGQTGTIPITAQSLTFFLGSAFGNLQVNFNGQNISYSAIGNGLNYTIYGADISSYAGQTGQLLFTAPVNNAGLLDNIQFSSLPVPEPSELALGALGALLLGFRRWKS